MPRQPRPDLAGVPQHVVQRGNDRQASFFGDVDYRIYLTGLREASLRYDGAVHAYVLMTNHVHLLLVADALRQWWRVEDDAVAGPSLRGLRQRPLSAHGDALGGRRAGSN